MDKIPFGKYKDTSIKLVNIGYLHWLNSQEWFKDPAKSIVEKELKRRLKRYNHGCEPNCYKSCGFRTICNADHKKEMKNAEEHSNSYYGSRIWDIRKPDSKSSNNNNGSWDSQKSDTFTDMCDPAGRI